MIIGPACLVATNRRANMICWLRKFRADKLSIRYLRFQHFNQLSNLSTARKRKHRLFESGYPSLYHSGTIAGENNASRRHHQRCATSRHNTIDDTLDIMYLNNDTTKRMFNFAKAMSGIFFTSLGTIRHGPSTHRSSTLRSHPKCKDRRTAPG